jgi:hypothetical protein
MPTRSQQVGLVVVLVVLTVDVCWRVMFSFPCQLLPRPPAALRPAPVGSRGAAILEIREIRGSFQPPHGDAVRREDTTI